MPHYRLHRDPGSSHQQIARQVRRLARGPVLDVGAAQGFLGQLLNGSGLVLDAIEPDPQCADACRPLYRSVFNGAVEDFRLAGEKYRVVVCGDVLEHTVDPLGVLRTLKGLAADDAVFIVSLPNVAHLAVRMMLFFGQFPRMDRGILDRTHLHFFTRDTAEQLLRQVGLGVTGVSTTGVPLDELWPRLDGSFLGRAFNGLQQVAVTLLPRLFAMQWIFTAQSHDTGGSR
jgi:hypothetical protein